MEINKKDLHIGDLIIKADGIYHNNDKMFFSKQVIDIYCDIIKYNLTNDLQKNTYKFFTQIGDHEISAYIYNYEYSPIYKLTFCNNKHNSIFSPVWTITSYSCLEEMISNIDFCESKYENSIKFGYEYGEMIGEKASDFMDMLLKKDCILIKDKFYFIENDSILSHENKLYFIDTKNIKNKENPLQDIEPVECSIKDIYLNAYKHYEEYNKIKFAPDGKEAKKLAKSFMEKI